MINELFKVDQQFQAHQMMPPTRAMQESTRGTHTDIKSHFKVFTVNLDSDRQALEEIMNKILNDPSYKQLSMESHFNRDGAYIVALSWVTFEKAK